VSHFYRYAANHYAVWIANNEQTVVVNFHHDIKTNILSEFYEGQADSKQQTLKALARYFFSNLYHCSVNC
jgi:hypothetical protein